MSRRRQGWYSAREKQVRRRKRIMLFGTLLLCVLLAGLTIKTIVDKKTTMVRAQNDSEVSFAGAPPLDVQLLTINEYSRPGISLKSVDGIVIHYTANPGASAQSNRDYFEGLKDSHETKASSHFIIGIEGEIIQCIPSDEISYASNERNKDSLAIECCHPEESGEFTPDTYQSLVELTGWLCERFGLTSKDVIRHYDITGKACPKYYVDHEESWDEFLQDVDDQIKVVGEMQE